jgi:hypothetical protein
MNSLAVLDARWHNHRVSGVYDTESVATEVAAGAVAAGAVKFAAAAVAAEQKRFPALVERQFGYAGG